MEIGIQIHHYYPRTLIVGNASLAQKNTKHLEKRDLTAS